MVILDSLSLLLFKIASSFSFKSGVQLRWQADAIIIIITIKEKRRKRTRRKPAGMVMKSSVIVALERAHSFSTSWQPPLSVRAGRRQRRRHIVYIKRAAQSRRRVSTSERERELSFHYGKRQHIPLALFLPLRTHRVSSGDRSSTLGRSSTLLSLSLWLASGSLSYFLFYTRGSLAADAPFFSTNLMTSQFWELADICDVWTNSAGREREKKSRNLITGSCI